MPARSLKTAEERSERLAERHPHRHRVNDLNRLDGLHLGAPYGVFLLGRLKLIFTASALNSAPSWNLIPSRSW